MSNTIPPYKGVAYAYPHKGCICLKIVIPTFQHIRAHVEFILDSTSSTKSKKNSVEGTLNLPSDSQQAIILYEAHFSHL